MSGAARRRSLAFALAPRLYRTGPWRPTARPCGKRRRGDAHPRPNIRQIQSPAAPIVRGMGLDRPFFDDKNRAFWILQSIGWTGYFLLRTLSGFANSMGWMWIVHTLLLTATGFSLTLLIATLFRRLITDAPVVDPDPVAGSGSARLGRFLDHRDVELRDLPQAAVAAGRDSNISAPSCSISRSSPPGRRFITGSTTSSCSRTRSTSASGSRARRRAPSWRCSATS